MIPKEQYNVVIAMPVGETMPGEAVEGQLRTVLEVSAHPKTAMVSVSSPCGLTPHDTSRQAVVDTCLQDPVDLIFWIDDDTLQPLGAFDRLLQTLVREESTRAASGLYYRRGWPYTNVWSVKHGDTYMNIDINSGETELLGSGLGSCLIDFQWCKKNLTRPWFEMWKKDDGTGTNVTDDISFFEKIHRAGGKLIGNADVKCVHLGKREWIDPITCDELRTLEEKRRKFIQAHQGKIPTIGGN